MTRSHMKSWITATYSAAPARNYAKLRFLNVYGQSQINILGQIGRKAKIKRYIYIVHADVNGRMRRKNHAVIWFSLPNEWMRISKIVQKEASTFIGHITFCVSQNRLEPAHFPIAHSFRIILWAVYVIHIRYSFIDQASFNAQIPFE